ncbi:DEAD/DEAH box helicase [Sinanaerobacter chloroacetimidivorans]|uniref:SNF2 helicase associated domain-containing protein n=1 Tax=Sinanaerobacter chloroacetimidivorans TaxID=2818044 RepID=A0A8J7W5G9_9FIRM|nr:SNF2 helicase associated domain-containing protein [Sinanaerobacter chloroacetimidivorans]MBR0599550.1 SNF2 helicase associated domain-containing protein [Sinanaerobacter chloroacetimidivorans]
MHIKSKLLLNHTQDFNDYQGMETKEDIEMKIKVLKELNEFHERYKPVKNQNSSPAVYTDPRIKSLINRYVMDEVVKATSDENVKVIPKLELEDGEAFLSITVGSGRQYVVRNLETFCNHMKTRSRTSYGKELDLLHHINSFEKESQPLVNFVLQKLEDKTQYPTEGINSATRYGYHYGIRSYGLAGDKKYMKLLPYGLDEFFQLYLNNKVNISVNGSTEAALFQDRTPEFYLEIKKLEKQKGYALLLPDCHYMLGKNHIYLYCSDHSQYGREQGISNTLCRCSRDFSRKLEDIIKAKLESRYLLTISNEDMASFCINVLSELKEYAEIRGDVEELKEFAPDELQTAFYLDAPQHDMVTAVVKYQYGELEININSLDSYVSKGITRDEKKEKKIAAIVQKFFKNQDPAHRFLYLTGDEEIYQFISEGLGEFLKLGQVFASERFKGMGIKRPPQITVGVQLESDLLNIELDTGGLPLSEAMAALSQYKQKRKYYRMKDGSFIKLEDAGFSELSEMVEGLGLSQKELNEGRIAVPKYRAMYLNQLLKASDNITFERNGHFKNLIRNMKAIDESDFTVPPSLDRIMREYQKDGFRWLAAMDSFGFGGILADDMGLGKTLQIISLLLSKKEEDEDSKALVVCPSSLILNWQNEIQKFSPQLQALAVIGTLEERKALIKEIDDADIVITSYDLLKRDVERYQQILFRYHIIDEAQYIKNHGTQNAKAVKAIRSQQRFALTGTPIENRLSELWSIFDFLMPAYLFSYKKFKDSYETEIVRNQDQAKIAMLSKQVAPFMLRRLKTSVLKELPEKIETVVFSQMEGEQKKLYLANLARIKGEINQNIQEKGFENSKIMILALLTRLRQLCCHPSLCYEDYKEGSAKLEACLELVAEATSAGHKVLLFSQFTSMLELLRSRLGEEGISHYLLTGATSKEMRMELVERFNQDETKVFLISLKAGGTGLNLTGADVVIHYDPWWNIAAQNQATDRTHRIGQKNSVQVYKLIEKGTVEEKILKLQESKKDLSDAIIKDDMAGLGSLSKEALMELLQP